MFFTFFIAEFKQFGSGDIGCKPQDIVHIWPYIFYSECKKERHHKIERKKINLERLCFVIITLLGSKKMGEYFFQIHINRLKNFRFFLIRIYIIIIPTVSINTSRIVPSRDVTNNWCISSLAAKNIEITTGKIN